MLLHLPAGHPKRAAILKHFQRHAAALVKWQNAKGFWHNVLDRPDSPEEVSGTAIFVMAFARGLANRWLDAAAFQPALLKGWQALTTRIEADGTVHDICAGSMCTEDEEYYVNRPFYDDDTHGLFAVLFAAIEMNRWEAEFGGHAGRNGAESSHSPREQSARSVSTLADR